MYSLVLIDMMNMILELKSLSLVEINNIADLLISEISRNYIMTLSGPFLIERPIVIELACILHFWFFEVQVFLYLYSILVN